MSKKIIQILQEHNISCLPNERFSLNVEMFPQSRDELSIPEAVLFEDPVLENGKSLTAASSRSFFTYFLDGAQRSYRVIDAQIGKWYLPFCAGQIGVAVLERKEKGQLAPLRKLTCVRNILSVPDKIPIEERQEIKKLINAALPEKYHFELVAYRFEPQSEKDPSDLGRAMIIDAMQKLELATIKKMMDDRMISPQTMLAKDGGLQYIPEKIKKAGIDIVQERNVIGLAKTFKPELSLGKGRRALSIGVLAKELEWKERTSVIHAPTKGEIDYGWWYLRLRPRNWMYSPLQGIIKIEVFASDDERERAGISKDRADTISSYVLAERNVTPYKADARWATHIYPIYLTETYLRASFLSHTRFKSLIF